ncbi:hypothetical protein [Alkalihalobacillus sp. BA299]|uniref:hypothetical protein n=1 Tax=Alkalihalobacillus sp. BA299 TaxID=2815938 RepID=UPI001ADBC6DB|nr:hypothetical protein [Alkalihalobacillus sp. BA299]
MKDMIVEAFEQFKQLEQEWNEHLILTFNCPKNIIKCGKSLDLHLDQVLETRKLAESWLKAIDAPTKNDVAMIANQFKRMEQKTDSLDEELFSLLQIEKHYKKVLKQFNHVLKDHTTTLDRGAKFLRPKSELEQLNEELKDLTAST